MCAGSVLGGAYSTTADNDPGSGGLTCDMSMRIRRIFNRRLCAMMLGIYGQMEVLNEYSRAQIEENMLSFPTLLSNTFNGQRDGEH